MKKVLIFASLSFCLLPSCKKDSGSQPGGGGAKTFAEFLVASEWVGTLALSGFNYPPPCYLKFLPGNKMTAYAPFAILTAPGVFKYVDSLNGTYTTVDSLPDGTNSVKAKLDLIGDVSLNVFERRELKVIPADPSRPSPYMKLDVYATPDVAIKNSGWSAPLLSPGRFAYPDVHGVQFAANGNTRYERNGVVLPKNAITGIVLDTEPAEFAYVQRGPMVFFSGVNESVRKFIPYFGVLGSGGKTMTVHSFSANARMPSYVSTANEYGFPGVPAVLQRR